MTSRLLGALATALAVGALLWTATGCVREDAVFTEGRLRTTCDGAIPVCDSRGACILGNDKYIDGQFPGGKKLIVPTTSDDNKLVVRFLLREMISPGTEILVRAHRPACSDFDERQVEADLFERAGDDRILQFELALPGEGDHLLEIFSDMSAEYSMTTTVEKSTDAEQ